MSARFALAALVSVTLTSAAYAQTPYFYTTPNTHYHASTVYESVARGNAEVIRAEGEFAVNAATAAVTLQKARELDQQNDLGYVTSRFEQRRINKNYRDSARGPRPSQAQISQMARQGVPERLSTSEFGVPVWPVSLDKPQYAEQREIIDRLFQDRDMNNSGLGSENQIEIAKATKALKNQLREEMASMSPAAYLQAVKFVDCLNYEARFQEMPAGLVSK